ncbi:PorP/SprF family type IX secretion system membrane protein [Chitinophaga rhizophila]|uniref:PorP/SprF family type IX secretion system membrane protein n=1 Tax=Chitinophaga rhizophila TaxID=2866212 RepID=A0ABS7G911_9BACT|nr:PorP/SprF family type IX secretion system membrane protein [Chitinophaga rhizophila]MBW8683790.1 PorP/SprF family type IX secretion system membrane protein [Chitinophaga rhizophila]
MRNILSIILVLPFLIFTGNTAKAQTDPHFSQYYVYPSWLNPALTGAFDGQYRIGAIYRNQWGNISDPFTTYGVAADFTTEKQFNFGASVLNQRAGDGGYNYTTAYGSASYTGVRFGAAGNHRVVFGLQFGLIQRKFDASKLTFGDQWNPITGYNPGTPSADGFSRTAATSFDAGAGVLYYDAAPGKAYNIFGGFSVAHLTRPTDQFSVTGDARFPMRFTGHAGVKLAVTDAISITPNILYLRQGNAEEKMAGAYGQLFVNPTTDVLLGVNYRFKDAVSTHAGFTYRSFTLGVSYDINTSELSKMARGSNSFELSLTFIGRKLFRSQEVEFVCPRL